MVISCFNLSIRVFNGEAGIIGAFPNIGQTLVPSSSSISKHELHALAFRFHLFTWKSYICLRSSGCVRPECSKLLVQTSTAL